MGDFAVMPSVIEAAARVRNGEMSAEELVVASLAAIERTNGDLNAFVHVDATRALSAAREVDARRRAGEVLAPLAGVPFAVKDLEDFAGMPTRRGSRWYADAGPAQRDDIHVERLRTAGAIPIGKTATPSLGPGGIRRALCMG